MPVATRTLPHRGSRMFLTDGGLETSLMFDDGFELPHFAAFHLLRHPEGRAALVRYYRRYLAIARSGGFGFVLESPTWRANADWAERLGYSEQQLWDANVDGVRLMRELRTEYETADTPVFVSGCVGPRGDGYVAGTAMTADAAQSYHTAQIEALASAGCDLVTVMTMTNEAEVIGFVRAAEWCGMTSVVSFTVETDGRLPSGVPLDRAILDVDAATDGGPAYYMINCAHPTHFAGVLASDAPWTSRIAGIRANSSCRSHAELDGAAELDRGNPEQLALEYQALANLLPNLRVCGGCCGTDHRHVAAIAAALGAGETSPMAASGGASAA